MMHRLSLAGHHMHELGTQRTELQHADGSSTCMLHTPDWDFNWQGRYYFKSNHVSGWGHALDGVHLGQLCQQSVYH